MSGVGPPAEQLSLRFWRENTSCPGKRSRGNDLTQKIVIDRLVPDNSASPRHRPPPSRSQTRLIFLPYQLLSSVLTMDCILIMVFRLRVFFFYIYVFFNYMF